MTKDDIIRIIASGDVSKIMPLLKNSNLSNQQIAYAFNEILKDSFEKLGHDIKNYHVCNDDAELQVGLVKNFIKTEKIEMPERKCDGPQVFYFPN